MKHLTVPLAIVSVALTGCIQYAPECGDEETTNLVKQIADREMTNQLGHGSQGLFTYTVNAIRTQSTNKETGAHTCAAQLGITATTNGVTNELPITYTVEVADNGEEFYVNVFGL